MAHSSADPCLTDALAATTPSAMDAGLTSAVLLRDSDVGIATTTIQTKVANVQATVAGYSATVGYLPFAAGDLWLDSVNDEAIREYSESIDRGGMLDMSLFDDLLTQVAVDIRDEKLVAVDECFQRWTRM